MLIQYVLGVINIILCLLMGLIGYSYPLFDAIFDYIELMTGLNIRIAYIIGCLIIYLIFELIVV